MNRTRGKRATSAANGGLTAIMPSESSGEKPLEIFDAAGNAHLVADRPKNVIGKKYREYVQP